MSLYSLGPRRDIRRGNDSDYVMANLDELVRAKAASEGDTEFLNLLNDIEDLSLVSQAVGDNYDVSINNTTYTRGKKNPKVVKGKDYGKIELRRQDKHKLGNTPATLNSIMMALDSRKHGPIVQREGRLPTAEDIRLRQIVENRFAGSTITGLAGVGLRGTSSHLPVDDRINRAADRIVELSYGYNPITGAPYGGVPLEGGHKLPHSKYPELSEARENMMFENNYENVIKGNREDEAEMLAYIRRIKDRITPKGKSKKNPEGTPAAVPIDAFTNLWTVGEGF